MPFAKTGGLGDVAGALPKALRETGDDVDAVLVHPLYEETKRGLLRELVFDNLEVEWLGGTRRVGVWYSEAPGAPTFLLDAPDYFARPGIYGHRDDHERFAFFCRAALALLRRLGTPPDVVHGNDWPCGFAAVELRARRNNDPFYARTRLIFSIHNLVYQGTFDPGELWRLGFGSHDEQDYFMLNGVASALKAGLMAGDVLSTAGKNAAYFRMVTSYWDMAAAFVNQGAIDEQMFNEANAEHAFIFAKIEPLLEELRAMFGPLIVPNLEKLVMRMPDAKERMAQMREMSRKMAERRAAAEAADQR